MNQQNLSISNFNRFIKQLLLPYAAACILLGLLINYQFENRIVLGSQISGSYKVNRIINELHSSEIAFFGSSRAEGTFIPDSLVKEGFNYGMSGIQDDVVLFFLDEECRKSSKSTPIVINFDLDGLNYSLGDVSSYIYNSNYKPVRQLMDSSYKTIYNFPLLKYYGVFELYFKFYLTDKFNLTKFVSKGASIEKNELTANKFEALVKERLASTNFFNNDPLLSAKLITIIKSNTNRKFIFVIPPYHNSFFKGFVNANEASIFLNSLKKLNNVVVLDFSKAHFVDIDFLNTSHLNLRGAIKFNRILNDSLKNYCQ